MLQSKLFCKTKKEIFVTQEPISLMLLLKGDFIEKSLSGVYRFLPLGFKVLKKIEGIIREEMEKIGAQEILLPALQNKKLWEETGRWEKIDPPLFIFYDRHKRELALGPTHEEEIGDLVRKRVFSFKDLPLSLFQIQNKFRNEMRPTGGLLRTREFLMKDLYSFHNDKKDLERFYKKVAIAYKRIFKRCNLSPIMVEASSGTIGGRVSHEFMVPAEVGEDKILVCPNCQFGANVERYQKDHCPKCNSLLQKISAIEIAHIFMLEDEYSKKMKIFFQDKDGNLRPVQMGCYGIGLPRLMATIVEKNHDQNGIIWPREVSPFKIHLIALQTEDPKVLLEAKKLYFELQRRKFEVLFDDRKDKSPGEKLVESDLIGIPIRVLVSRKLLEEKKIEIKKRNQKTIKKLSFKRAVKYLENQ